MNHVVTLRGCSAKSPVRSVSPSALNAEVLSTIDPVVDYYVGSSTGFAINGWLQWKETYSSPGGRHNLYARVDDSYQYWDWATWIARPELVNWRSGDRLLFEVDLLWLFATTGGPPWTILASTGTQSVGDFENFNKATITGYQSQKQWGARRGDHNGSTLGDVFVSNTSIRLAGSGIDGDWCLPYYVPDDTLDHAVLTVENESELVQNWKNQAGTVVATRTLSGLIDIPPIVNPRLTQFWGSQQAGNGETPNEQNYVAGTVMYWGIGSWHDIRVGGASNIIDSSSLDSTLPAPSLSLRAFSCDFLRSINVWSIGSMIGLKFWDQNGNPESNLDYELDAGLNVSSKKMVASFDGTKGQIYSVVRLFYSSMTTKTIASARYGSVQVIVPDRVVRLGGGWINPGQKIGVGTSGGIEVERLMLPIPFTFPVPYGTFDGFDCGRLEIVVGIILGQSLESWLTEIGVPLSFDE
jgi:hypothetical protein